MCFSPNDRVVLDSLANIECTEIKLTSLQLNKKTNNPEFDAVAVCSCQKPGRLPPKNCTQMIKSNAQLVHYLIDVDISTYHTKETASNNI